ncbi:MAG: PAS domain-containing sensor histidine kinase [Candidatus Parcubacteria bacterium]|nr:PAS domain-containing sensor histidine kinase [Candidatus Parcubacteria bacterium]
MNGAGFLKNILGHIEEGIIFITPSGKISYANSAAECILKLALSEIEGVEYDDPKWNALDSRGMPISFGNTVALKERKIVKNMEMRLRALDGSITWLNVNAYPAYDNAGIFIGVVETFGDISKRKQTEEILRKKDRDFSTIVEHATDMIVRFDTNLRYMYYNLAVEKQFGMSSGLIGKSLLDIIPQGHELRQNAEFVNTSLLEAMEMGKVQTVEQNFPSSSGTKYYFTEIIPEYNAGVIESLLCISRDITELKNFQKRIQDARAEILFAVSHEMKTPLMILGQASEMMLKSPNKFEEYKALWLRNLRRLDKMINNLVDSQRGDKDMPLVLTLCDSIKIVSRVIADVEPVARMAGIEIKLRHESLPLGLVDDEAIGRAIENLLTNAIKFSPRGEKVIVDLRMEMKGEKLNIKITDHGNGIDEEEQKFLFMPFSRGRSAQKKGVPGTGLGLFVTKKIVESHGGVLLFQSELGKGTKVTISLPWTI